MNPATLISCAALRKGLALFIVFLLGLTPGLGWAADDNLGASQVGGLSIGTDPDGASVYLDGKFVGQTPLMLKSVAVGDHRVRIVKSGYLENLQIVGVRAREPKTLEMKLTRQSGATAEAESQVVSGGGGGGILS